MNRRCVLQNLAILSVSSTTLAAFGEVSSADVAFIRPQSLSAALKTSREMCGDLLSRLDRIESRSGMFTGLKSAVSKDATNVLQELSVLLEQTGIRITAIEQQAVALSQACVDSLMRAERSLNSLCRNGTLSRSVVDSSVPVFGRVRHLLLSLPVA